MSIEMRPLFETAFFVEEVQNASESIERALETYEANTHTGARVFEVVAPDDPDDAWVDDKLVRRLVYFCESEGSPAPRCGGVIVALFHAASVYGITAEQAVRWGSGILGLAPDELRQRYGLSEAETAQR